MLIRVFCLLLLIGSSAAHAGLFGDDKAREQIEALRQQVESLEARVAQMETALKSQALLELYSQVETMSMELGKLRGEIEVLSNDNASLQKRQRDFYIDLDNRLRLIEQPDATQPSYTDPPGSRDDGTDADTGAAAPIDSSIGLAAAASSPADSPPPISAVDTETGLGTDIAHYPAPADTSSGTQIAAIPSQNPQSAGPTEKQFYDAAYRQFVNGDYTGAKSQFETFLEHYRNSSLAPSAAYWIGNAHYALREFQQAITAQRNLIDRYPDSAKVPDALLNIASSQTEMADRAAARKTLEELIANYPFSNAAEKAKQRLSRLN